MESWERIVNDGAWKSQLAHSTLVAFLLGFTPFFIFDFDNHWVYWRLLPMEYISPFVLRFWFLAAGYNVVAPLCSRVRDFCEYFTAGKQNTPLVCFFYSMKQGKSQRIDMQKSGCASTNSVIYFIVLAVQQLGFNPINRSFFLWFWKTKAIVNRLSTPTLVNSECMFYGRKFDWISVFSLKMLLIRRLINQRHWLFGIQSAQTASEYNKSQPPLQTVDRPDLARGFNK